jgi:hypothetical protein
MRAEDYAEDIEILTTNPEILENLFYTIDNTILLVLLFQNMRKKHIEIPYHWHERIINMVSEKWILRYRYQHYEIDTYALMALKYLPPESQYILQKKYSPEINNMLLRKFANYEDIVNSYDIEISDTTNLSPGCIDYINFKKKSLRKISDMVTVRFII